MRYLFIPPAIAIYCCLLVFAIYFLMPEYNYIIYPFNLGGIVFLFFGLSIMGKTKELFKQHKTTLKFEESATFIKEGIFRKTRNPIYLGMASVILGIAICSMNIFAILLPVVFCLYIHFFILPIEEKLLSDKFGEKYFVYKKDVKTWL